MNKKYYSDILCMEFKQRLVYLDFLSLVLNCDEIICGKNEICVAVGDTHQCVCDPDFEGENCNKRGRYYNCYKRALAVTTITNSGFVIFAPNSAQFAFSDKTCSHCTFGLEINKQTRSQKLDDCEFWPITLANM